MSGRRAFETIYHELLLAAPTVDEARTNLELLATQLPLWADDLERLAIREAAGRLADELAEAEELADVGSA